MLQLALFKVNSMVRSKYVVVWLGSKFSLFELYFFYYYKRLYCQRHISHK